MTLIFIHCNDFDSYLEGISKAAAVLSVLMTVYTNPCHDRGHINVMLVLQSCTDSPEVMADSSTETFPTISDVTYEVTNIKVEEEIDMKEGEEVNVKTENVIVSEELECMDMKDEEGIYSVGENEEEDIDTQKEEDTEIKEEES